jgi:DNA-binding NarL/FixJ family response regulator
MSDGVTVIIADDHPMFRKGVAEVLRADPSITVLGEASDGEAALALIQSRTPRVAVVDLEMPKKTGLEVAAAAREAAPDVSIVLLTMHAGADILQRALAVGVRGYVSKESAADDLLACVHLVAGGRTYVSASLGKAAAVAVGPKNAPALASLSPAERNVLRYIARNQTTREIAEALDISPKTVENHRSKICQKLSVTGNNALVRFAMEHVEELRAL